jgi:hypothetical protein
MNPNFGKVEYFVMWSLTGGEAEVVAAVLPDGHGEVLKDKFQISSVKPNAEAVASMRSHRLG